MQYQNSITKESAAMNIIAIVESVNKKQNMKNFLSQLKEIMGRQKKIYHFASRQNSDSIQQFLYAGNYNCDLVASGLRKDTQRPSQKVRVENKNLHVLSMHDKSDKLKKKAHKISHFSQHNNSLKSLKSNSSQVNIQNETPHVSSVVPLFPQECQISESQNEFEDIYDQARQRKTHLSLRRTKIFTKSIQQKKTTHTNHRKNMPKTNRNDKFNYLQHFIQMEVNVNQNDLSKQSIKSQKNKKKIGQAQTQSTPVSPRKNNSGFGLLKGKKWQPLVTQDRMLRLKSFQNIRLSPGVSLNSEENKPSGNSSFMMRKRLQFLKNNDLDSAKIKLNELMSFKKLGTTNHLAYCSSFKTVKTIKLGTDSNISIDSRKMLSEQQLNSKKLIKVLNKKVYDQLIKDDNDSNTETLKRSRFKKQKQNKVRFDSINLN